MIYETPAKTMNNLDSHKLLNKTVCFIIYKKIRY